MSETKENRLSIALTELSTSIESLEAVTTMLEEYIFQLDTNEKGLKVTPLNMFRAVADICNQAKERIVKVDTLLDN